MASSKKVNPSSKANPDTGFGVQAEQIGGRFVNKDGSFNVRKKGLPLWKTVSAYSYLQQLSWPVFFSIIFVFYFLVNVFFTAIYFLLGKEQFQGINATSTWSIIKEIFFFSTETFTTVGYGRVNPLLDGANFVASIEALIGWLSFALVTGLLYGRFTQPKAYLAFSENALISPYKDGIALMFRIVPYKVNHHLTDARVTVNIAYLEGDENKPEYKFYQLNLERSKIDAFTMNWTVVHPIDEESPLLNFAPEDLKRSDVELYVQVTGFDHIFSNTVMQRTSYTYEEIIWGAKFQPMYQEATAEGTTVLHLDKLNCFDKVELPVVTVPNRQLELEN
jgi:inward rectifier potassium channel